MAVIVVPRELTIVSKHRCGSTFWEVANIGSNLVAKSSMDAHWNTGKTIEVLKTKSLYR